MTNDFEWIQFWYQTQCDGDWEHEFGITIETVDNPGWYIVINLAGTECEGHSFPTVKNEIDETNWYFCLTRDNNFEASCGPRQLATVLRIFREWVELCQKNSLEIESS